ncbi:MAG TPA: beta-galactosidase [Phycisphaerae bacterium]|nr:beta-galactosidase [Phycisphaerae bacterium]
MRMIVAGAIAGLMAMAVVAAGQMGGEAAAPASQPADLVPMTTIVPDGKPHRFELKDHAFEIDGQKTLLIAGEMHFGRVLPEDFEKRVKQAKAMGLNTISFYLFWNQVEPEEGKFDFTGANDVRRMFKICQDNGMWVLLRPGPYCCAEVDYGGIPYWTLKHPEVKIRTNDPQYVAWSKAYIDRVYKEVADLQVTKGGPLLMVQEENEFGMVARGDYSYMTTLHGIFKDAGFDIPIYACDPGSFSGRGGANPYGEDVLRGRNGLNGQQAYDSAYAAAGDGPVYAPEVYTAWFSGWGQPIATRNASLPAIVNWTNFLLDHNASWCYYMFFGGTNWGFSNGCNEYLPVQTSYDYGAPIDEAGRPTQKFFTLRDILAKRTGRTPPAPPPDPDVAALPAIQFTQRESLEDWLPKKPTLTADKPVSMENLNQAYGFVLYRKQFPNGLKGKLELQGARDYSIVMANGKPIGDSFVGLGLDSNKLDVNESGPTTLDILVYNLGRISVIVNSNAPARASKGMEGATLDGKELTGWDMYSLPMNEADGPLTSAPAAAPAATPSGPAFYTATFHVDRPAGTFLDMRNWHFGAVWVNGHNLGRFWDRGGLRSLFLSSHFLKEGDNQITVLELKDPPVKPELAGAVNIIQEPPVPFAIRLDQANLNPAAQRGPGAGFGPARGGRGRGRGPGGPGGPGGAASQPG